MAARRRLAAIMFTDMVGYSALAQRDETRAVRLVNTQRELLRPIFRAHEGREVKTIGDGFLVEFPSALHAVECAVATQQRLLEHGGGAESDRIELRIGVHLGDVIDQGGDLLGDAVNIASRIEPLAESTGVCISGPVFDQVRNKISYGCTQLDHVILKNIDSPISVYSVDLPWVAPPAARVTPWTDRESELHTLERVFADVARGRGQIIGLSGEPGVGKTRLADEGIRRAEGKAFRILRGRGHQDEQPVPYSVWVQVVRDWVRDAPPPLLYKICAGCGPELARLAPEVGERLGLAGSPPSEDPATGRLRFFEGIAQFFANLSRESPLAILLDDLQWADPGSLRLLNHLAEPIRGQRVLLLLTYRDSVGEGSPLLRTVLEDVGKAHAFTEIPVRRMEGGPARQLVGAILATQDPPPELVGLVGEKTGGNPLFVEELLRSMAEEQQLVRRGERWHTAEAANVRVPSTMRDLILKRVARAGEQSLRILSVAAVLGPEFDFDFLQKVSGIEPESLLAEVEALLRARLLREREISPGRSVYLFADDQTRDVLYHELSLIRRQRYHLKAAQALEERSPGKLEAIAGELALHFRRGSDPGKALTWTIVAARKSSLLYAREQAVSYFRTALEILSVAPDQRVRAEVLEAMADELEILGQYEESARSRVEASQAYEAVGDPRRAGAALHRAATHARWTQLGEFVVDEEQLARARALLESAPPSAELARFYLDDSAYFRAAGRFDESRPLVTRALELAEALRDPTIEATARIALAYYLPIGSRAEVKQTLDRAIALGREHDPSIAVLAYYRRAHFAATGYADFAETEAWIQQGAEYAHSVNALDMEAAFFGSLGAFVKVWSSDMEGHDRRAAEHQQYLREHGQKSVHNLYHIGLGPLTRGDFDEAERVMNRAKALLDTEEAWYMIAWYYLYRGMLESARGNYPAAEDSYVKALASDRARGQTEFDAFRPIWFLAGAIDAAVRQHALDRTDRYLVELREAVARVDEKPARAYLAKGRGQRALEHGEFREAARFLRESADIWREIDWGRELAQTIVQLAEAEARGGRPDLARAVLDEAIGVFRSMGAKVELDRALSFREELGTGG